MTISANTQAILLLTAYFKKADNNDEKPLTPKEWGRFALWLRDRAMTPEDLLIGDLTKKLFQWSDSQITIERLTCLLSRGSALALAVEKWLRAGLWVMTRSDVDYPKLLKIRLKNDSPPILFGCGNRNLLNQGGIAVVGSRNAMETDLVFSRELGGKAASTGFSIISGGARGVDEAAMLGALTAEGTVIGVLADSLLRTTSSAKYRSHLMRNNLVLVSPFHPEAGFNAGNAMQRNRYIYCLSDAAIAIHSGTAGGTWNGVVENLKKAWVPMWVKQTNDPIAGNAELIAKGALWLPSSLSEVDLEKLKTQPATKAYTEISDLFSQQALCVKEPVEIETVKAITQEAAEPANRDDKEEVINPSFYQLFLSKVELLCRNQPRTGDELEKKLDLSKSQLNTWIKQAMEDDKLEKLSHPVRYQWQKNQQRLLE